MPKYHEGDKIGMLTLIEKFSVTNNSGRKRNKWKCMCDCGNITYVFASNLGKTQSCGHLIAEERTKRLLKDLTEQKFGRLTVLKKAEDRMNKCGHKVVRYECQCECGTIKEIDAAELRKGSTLSCGCLAKEQSKLRNLKDLTGKHFGKLVVIKQLESAKYGKSTMTKWLAKCECGSTIEVFGNALRKGQISCGCCNSKGEEEIAKLLSDLNIDFKRQYTFNDLTSVSGKKLPFDFAIIQNGKLSLLEYQGIQHYIPQKNHFGDYQRNITDKAKRDYCTKHNIVLNEVRFDEDIQSRIMELYGNPVPSVV